MRRFTFSLAWVAFLVAGVLLAQSDPGNGTWKLNAAKSKVTAGPALKSGTRTSQVAGDTTKISFDQVDSTGAHQTYSLTIKYDGKDYPITGTGPNGADTIALKMVDASTVDATLKKAGKVVMTSRRVVSKDGKTMTLTSKGTGADGKPTDAVTVWEKQ